MTSLYAYLSYRDAPAALDWMQEIGFEIVSRQDGEEGTVLHSEVRLGNVVLMVSSMDDDYVLAPLRDHSTGHGLYLVVDDVGAIHSAAIDGGAREVLAPERTEWGTERSRVLDPEGYEWSFGTYTPGGTW
jgi:uncharacterized glyoxalase superfamily protein PhnB